MPPLAPLAMPRQVLLQAPSGRGVNEGSRSTPYPARWLTFGGSMVMTLAASHQMMLTLPLNESLTPIVNAQLWLWVVLFAFTFQWIALSATTAVTGLFAVLSRPARRRADPGAALRGKTALVMPIYNEDTDRLFATLAAMGEDLKREGLHRHFDIVVLSDSSTPAQCASEKAAIARLRAYLSDTLPVWYRRRAKNTERKAGNIRDFVQRWGRHYDYMVVLDADSLMSGQVLGTLVREMEADPTVGIVQTLPRLCGGETLYARLQQFAGFAYDGVFAQGLCAWQGDDGNYWGHNAIIRVTAFAQAAGLPTLAGPAPFGGEIRSHDFVEAALIRRAGWTVRMLPDLNGTWEECPPTLWDAAVRDRRWAQGNVQHMAVLTAKGLLWPSRVHFLMGVMNYLASLLWLAMLVLGVAVTAQLAGPEASVAEVWSGVDAQRMMAVVLFSAVLLLLPKWLGALLAVANRRQPAGTGRVRFCVSALLELVVTVLLTPILMIIHSRHLWEIARGKDSGWSTQRRQHTGPHWQRRLARYGALSLIGAALMPLLFWLSPSLMLWMLPIGLGLSLAVPITALVDSPAVGQWLKRHQYLIIPEESVQPDILRRRETLLAQIFER